MNIYKGKGRAEGRLISNHGGTGEETNKGKVTGKVEAIIQVYWWARGKFFELPLRGRKKKKMGKKGTQIEEMWYSEREQ